MQNTQFTQSNVYDPQNEKVRVVERIVEIRQPVQIELTPKKYKRWMLRGERIGGFGILLGIAGTLGSFYIKEGALGLIIVSWFFGIIFLGIGKFILSWAKFEAWWNNG